jgi:hypothetical protein
MLQRTVLPRWESNPGRRACSWLVTARKINLCMFVDVCKCLVCVCMCAHVHIVCERERMRKGVHIYTGMCTCTQTNRCEELCVITGKVLMLLTIPAQKCMQTTPSVSLLNNTTYRKRCARHTIGVSISISIGHCKKFIKSHNFSITFYTECTRCFP